MKFDHPQEFTMRPKENCVDSMKVMDKAFENIMNEIVEHVIEGICFEAHRAVKLGYFPVEEYRLKEHKFEIDYGEETPGPDSDIFANGTKSVHQYTVCHFCNERKATTRIMKHLETCRSKPNDNSNGDNNGKRENYENNLEDEDNSDGKKINGKEKKQAKSAPNYDTMTPEEKQDFLSKYCGVVSTHTGIPCRNSITCTRHMPEDKEKVRGHHSESPPDHYDCDIDRDTVD